MESVVGHTLEAIKVVSAFRNWVLALDRFVFIALLHTFEEFGGLDTAQVRGS